MFSSQMDNDYRPNEEDDAQAEAEFQMRQMYAIFEQPVRDHQRSVVLKKAHHDYPRIFEPAVAQITHRKWLSVPAKMIEDPPYRFQGNQKAGIHDAFSIFETGRVKSTRSPVDQERYAEVIVGNNNLENRLVTEMWINGTQSLLLGKVSEAILDALSDNVTELPDNQKLKRKNDALDSEPEQLQLSRIDRALVISMMEHYFRLRPSYLKTLLRQPFFRGESQTVALSDIFSREEVIALLEQLAQKNAERPAGKFDQLLKAVVNIFKGIGSAAGTTDLATFKASIMLNQEMMVGQVLAAELDFGSFGADLQTRLKNENFEGMEASLYVLYAAEIFPTLDKLNARIQGYITDMNRQPDDPELDNREIVDQSMLIWAQLNHLSEEFCEKASKIMWQSVGMGDLTVRAFLQQSGLGPNKNGETNSELLAGFKSLVIAMPDEYPRLLRNLEELFAEKIDKLYYVGDEQARYFDPTLREQLVSLVNETVAQLKKLQALSGLKEAAELNLKSKEERRAQTREALLELLHDQAANGGRLALEDLLRDLLAKMGSDGQVSADVVERLSTSSRNRMDLEELLDNELDNEADAPQQNQL